MDNNNKVERIFQNYEVLLHKGFSLDGDRAFSYIAATDLKLKLRDIWNNFEDFDERREAISNIQGEYGLKHRFSLYDDVNKFWLLTFTRTINQLNEIIIFKANKKIEFSLKALSAMAVARNLNSVNDLQILISSKNIPACLKEDINQFIKNHYRE